MDFILLKMCMGIETNEEYGRRIRVIDNIVENCTQIIKNTIIDVWKQDIKNDYDNHLLLKEDTLKNAFYYHLRRRLGENFLQRNKLAIFTEYYIDGERIDLVVVEIDPLKAKDVFLGDCVNSILAVVEMKYKGAYAAEEVFQKDVDKIMKYRMNNENDTQYYLAFIREIVFDQDDVAYWITSPQQILANNRITELLAYHISEQDEMIWDVKVY